MGALYSQIQPKHIREVGILSLALLRAVLVVLGVAATGSLLLLSLLLLFFLLFPLRFGFRLRWDTESEVISWKLRLWIPFTGYVSYGRRQKVADLLAGEGTEPEPVMSPNPHRKHRIRRWMYATLRRLARRAAGLGSVRRGRGTGSPVHGHSLSKGWEVVDTVLQTFCRLHLRVRFGTGDAAATALLYGTFWAVLVQLPLNWEKPGRQPARPAVELIPDFAALRGILAVRCIGAVRLGQIILALTRYWVKSRRRGRLNRRRIAGRIDRHAAGHRGETSHG